MIKNRLRQPPLIELEIVELFTKGDKRCITLIDEYYGKALHIVAHRIMLDEDLAKDMVQESLIKVWRHRHRYNSDKGSLYTWLYRIVRNTSLDTQRTLSKNNSRYIRDDLSYVDNFTSTSLNTDALDLGWNIDKLPLRYSDVVRASYFDGYTQEEISERLGIPLGTVKSRVKIGIRELRKIYIK